jgi:hypothetical protein
VGVLSLRYGAYSNSDAGKGIPAMEGSREYTDKQPPTADKGSSSSLGLNVGLANSYRKKISLLQKSQKASGKDKFFNKRPQ